MKKHKRASVAKFKSQKGVALVAVLVFFSTVFMGLSTFTNLTSSHLNVNALSKKGAQAFYLAEAAAEAAKAQLRDDFETTPVQNDGTVFSLGSGEYYFNVAQTANPNERLVTGYGAFPDFTSPEQTKVVEVLMQNTAFFEDAVSAAGDINLGEDADVNGDIFVGDDYTCDDCNITGTVTEMNDPNYPLPLLDFDALKAIAQSQTYDGHDNYYTKAEMDSGNPPLPSSFYFTPPGGGNPGVPHVVYIEDNLRVDEDETIGGFIIVVGDSSTAPEDVRVILEQESRVSGILYTTGDVVMNEEDIRVEGAIMAQNIRNGDELDELTINYNQTYTDSLASAGIVNNNMDQISWNEKDPSS